MKSMLRSALAVLACALASSASAQSNAPLRPPGPRADVFWPKASPAALGGVRAREASAQKAQPSPFRPGRTFAPREYWNAR
jgi:hypothetical protein